VGDVNDVRGSRDKDSHDGGRMRSFCEVTTYALERQGGINTLTQKYNNTINIWNNETPTHSRHPTCSVIQYNLIVFSDRFPWFRDV
jgi:hypothetical protein